MNDLKTLYNKESGIQIPIEKPSELSSHKDRYDEYAHTPYVDEEVVIPEYPVSEDGGGIRFRVTGYSNFTSDELKELHLLIEKVLNNDPDGISEFISTVLVNDEHISEV